MNKIIFIIIVACSFFFVSLINPNKIDYVPNKETAIKIAEAIWLPIYGQKIYDNRPFDACIDGDTAWHVFGSMPTSKMEIDDNGDTTFIYIFGGAPHAIIRKSDAKILNVYHTK